MKQIEFYTQLDEDGGLVEQEKCSVAHRARPREEITYQLTHVGPLGTRYLLLMSLLLPWNYKERNEHTVYKLLL